MFFQFGCGITADLIHASAKRVASNPNYRLKYFDDFYLK